MLIVHSKDKLCAKVARIEDNIHWAWKNNDIFPNYEKEKKKALFEKQNQKTQTKNVKYDDHYFLR